MSQRKSIHQDQKQIKEQKIESFVHEPSQEGRFLSIVQEQQASLSIKQNSKIIDQFSFKKLIQKNYRYVDKSLLLYELFPNKVNLITRPGRWGKSLACHMVSCFFKMECDSKGKKLEVQPYLNYFRGGKIDKNNMKLQSLKIWKFRKEFCQQNQAKYPVLHLTLKQTMSGGYVESKFRFIVELNSCLRKQFKYIKKVGDESYEITMYLEQLEKLNNITKLDYIKNSEEIKSFNIVYSLRTIFDGIQSFHHQQCILIIDQYDVPITSMMKNKLAKLDYIYQSFFYIYDLFDLINI